MLLLKRLEVEGFGPFAERQTLNFPTTPGVTVVYGENMRGKTSLLNAIRYAFFGTVLGRGARPRRSAASPSAATEHPALDRIDPPEGSVSARGLLALDCPRCGTPLPGLDADYG